MESSTNYCLNCNKYNAEIYRFTGKRFCSRGCELLYGQKKATEGENQTVESLKSVFGMI